MRKIKFTAIILILSFMSTFSVYAEEEQVLTADDAVKAALSNNIDLSIEKINVIIKERNFYYNWNVLIPRITTSASISRANVEPISFPPFFGIPPTPRNRLSTSLSMNWTLSAQTYFNMKQTSLELDAGIINRETAEKRLERDVRKTFYNLILVEQSIKLMQKNIQASKARFDSASVNFKNGLVDQYTILAAQVEYENMLPNLKEIENAYEISMMSFKILTGIPLEKQVKLSGSLEEVRPFAMDEQKLVDRYMASRLDIATLRNSVQQIENSRNISRASMFPSLNVTLSYDPTFQKDALKDNWFSDISNDWIQMNGMLSVSLSMAIDPWIPFSKTRTDIVNAGSNLEKIKLTLKKTETAAELDIRTIVRNLQKSENSLESLKLNLTLAEKANQMGQDAYKAGTKDYSQIEQTEFTLQNAQFNLLKEKFNYISGLYDLTYAIDAKIDDIKSMNAVKENQPEK